MANHNRLEGLPAELLAEIMVQLPDLVSLANLIEASPSAYRLFNVRASQVFDAVLSSGLTHRFTCGLIRIATVLRSNALPAHVQNLGVFESLLRRETSLVNYEDDSDDPNTGPPWPYPPLAILANTSAAILHGVLATNRKITRTATHCLAVVLEQFRSHLPRRLVDTDLKSTHEQFWRTPPVLCQLKPPEAPVMVRDIGPPTWVEQQRVLRAFWRVQTFYEVQNAALKSFISWKMDKLDHQSLLPLIPFDEGTKPEESWNNGAVFEHDLIDIALYYNSQNMVITPDSGVAWPTPTPTGESDYETLDNLSSPTYAWFRNISRRSWAYWSAPAPPIMPSTFERFMRLGFAIWSRERMVGIGLLPPADEWLEALPSLFVTWSSVLT
ncbi:hypothetical protein BX600DRAFT_536868 [Xylariales sp. PMI_506]|nr:hypothetical protein BX600DRAFT_536868 [Xylariales sp. PMI_506]